MQIVITGRHVGVTEPMKSYAREKVQKLERYFDRVTHARVTMDIQHDSHQVEMQLDLVRGQSAVGRAEAPDMYAALDLAEQKLAQQLRRFNQRLKDHHRGERRGPPAAWPAPAEAASEQATYEDVIEDLRRGAGPETPGGGAPSGGNER